MSAKKLVTANVVVAANTFNVSIFNLLWLTKNGVFTESEMLSDDCVFVPVAAQVGTPNCHLLVLAERLQLTLKVPQKDVTPLDKVKRIVELLPQTPYTAVGLNIVWDMVPGEDEDLGAVTRMLFAVPERPLYKQFMDANARFGAYMSKDFAGFRLKLDLKPAMVEPDTSRAEVVRLHFNFHLDVGGLVDKKEAVLAAVGKWSTAYAESDAIAGLLVTPDKVKPC